MAMQRLGFSSLDAIKFFEKINDVIWYINDKDHLFPIEEFYDVCTNGNLLSVLESHGFDIPLSDDEKEIFNDFIGQEIGGQKPFENGRSALMYYSWQGIITYLESNKLL